MRLALLALAVAPLVACTASTADPETASGESDLTSVLSCSAKRTAALQKQTQKDPQGYWRHLELPVMQRVADVYAIRERMDGLADEPLATRMQAFATAKKAASKLDLLSLDQLVTFLNARYGFGLTLDGFTTDGTYTKPYTRSSADFADADLRGALYLAKNVFATASGGVTDTDAEVEKQKKDLFEKSWMSTNIPLHGGDVNVDALTREGNGGSGRFFCSTPGANNLRSIAATADTAIGGGDGNTSLLELATYAKSRGATVQTSPFVRVDFGSAAPADAWQLQSAWECASQAFYFGARSIQLPTYSALPSPAGDGFCGSIDLLANQVGGGTRYTGHVVSVTMGQKDYEVVMLKASVLAPGIRGMLCLDPGDELKLYVPYGQSVISECGLVNGLYRAAYYHLDARVESDNWSPN